MSILDNLKKLFGTQNNPEIQTNPENSQQQKGPKKVLIVEDEEMLANAMELKCKQAGFEVYKAANGKQGLELAISQKPNIILLDLLMPVMDGKTMLHELRSIEELKFTPVIILTNSGEVDNLRETKIYHNASAFLIKSNVTPDEILKTINEYT